MRFLNLSLFRRLRGLGGRGLAWGPRDEENPLVGAKFLKFPGSVLAIQAAERGIRVEGCLLDLLHRIEIGRAGIDGDHAGPAPPGDFHTGPLSNPGEGIERMVEAKYRRVLRTCRA